MTKLIYHGSPQLNFEERKKKKQNREWIKYSRPWVNLCQRPLPTSQPDQLDQMLPPATWLPLAENEESQNQSKTKQTWIEGCSPTRRGKKMDVIKFILSQQWQFKRLLCPHLQRDPTTLQHLRSSDCTGCVDHGPDQYDVFEANTNSYIRE